MQAGSKKIKLLVSVISILFAFGLCEIVLHFWGYQAGRIYYDPWFRPVDSLVVYKHTFIADSNGITSFSQDAAQYIHLNILQPSIQSAHEQNVFSEVESLPKDFIQLRASGISNALADKFKALSASKIEMNDLDSAILDYTSNPINAFGFKSIAFKQYTSAKKKLLVIGDSHAFGHSSTNISSGFADILLAKGYAVYNTGLSGSDPAQYEAIAAQFIGLLQPDAVIVNLFLENDILYHNRTLKPHQPYLWVTNAGHLFACPEGIYFRNPEEAYRNMLRNYFIPNNSLFNKLASKTIIGTFFWRALQKYTGTVNNSTAEFMEYDKQVKFLRTKAPYTLNHLLAISNYCKLNGAEFLVFSVPKFDGKTWKHIHDFEGIPKDFNCYEPSLLCEDYALIGGHLNDKGHKKFAEFILKLLE